ncbi:MAG TPA: DDE-type integrase/transposase/recombinase [bacterium]|nr:DDE-type integrase/transposase/recombinase [bacterium]
MKENGISSKIKKKFQKTTNSNYNSEIVPNILAETEKTNAPNQAWISDITYIWTKAGWLYLAVIIDVFNRGVIGWSMSNRITKELVISAFLMAVFNKNPGSGVVFHSDRGSQYVSNEFKVVLKFYYFI